MNVSEVLNAGGEYFKATDVPKTATGAFDLLKLTISGVEKKDFEEKGTLRPKFILAFSEDEHTLILNATNTRIVAAAYGDEVDAWIGKLIGLTAAPVNFGGKMVDGLQVRTPSAAQLTTVEPTAATPAPAGAAQAAPAAAVEFNDDIPF